MAKATSSGGSGSWTQVQVSSTASPTDDQSGEPKRRARRANVARHSRKCTVCHHPDREFIDQDYLRWLSPKKIAHEYKISHHSVVYRHADATGLRAQRRASLRATLENFIEQAESVRATAGSVVAAVRLYAQINDQGQWTPPVRRHIVEHRYTTSADPAAIPAPLSKKDGLLSPVTSAANSAVAPDSEETKNHPERAKGPAQAHKNSDPVNATGSLQPVATITAGSAVPFGASPNKFPAVPVASINFAPVLPISNREHVKLEHAATR